MTDTRSSPDSTAQLQGKKLAEAHSLLQECGYNFYEVHPECYRNFSYVKFFHLLEARGGVAQAAPLAHAFRNADEQDWAHLFRYLPDSGHGQFWKAVFGEVRASLYAMSSTLHRWGPMADIVDAETGETKTVDLSVVTSKLHRPEGS